MAEIDDALSCVEGEKHCNISRLELDCEHPTTIATAYRRLLAENEGLKKSSHEHCVTPCDSIRIQSENHSAWTLMKERAEKAEAALAQVKKALENLLDCSACQNNCAPDDTTCATSAAYIILSALKGVQP